MTVNEACNVLHVDDGDNNALIASLVEAIPSYIETTTGLPEEQQINEPLVDVVSGFLVTQWYYGDHADERSLTRTITALLKAISVRARSYAE